jgi:hypothetical protein
VLLKFAKSNQPAIVVLIPLIGLVIWYNPFFVHHNFQGVTTMHEMPLYDLLLSILQMHPLLSKLLSFVIFIGVSFYLNHLNTKYIFIAERTYLPSIIYISIACILINIKGLYPSLPAALFLLIAIERLLDTYKDERLSYNVFDSGLLVGIASLFYFNILFFIIFFWIALLIVRKFYWREWLYILMGAFLPYLLLFSFYYLTNRNFELIFQPVKDNFIIHNKIHLSRIQDIAGIFIIVLILLASQYIMRIFSSKKILARKSYNLFLVAFLVSLAVYYCVPAASIDIIFIACIPVSFLVSHFFIRPRKSRWLEVIFDLLIIGLILTQLISF